MGAWMEQTWWLYDLTVAAIVILCVWSGWRRGLAGSVSRLVGFGAAAILAGFLSRPAAEFVYDRWLGARCADILEQHLDNYDVAETLEQALTACGVQMDDAQWKAIAADPEHAADSLYDTVEQETGLPAGAVEVLLTQSIDTTAIQQQTGLPAWMAEALVPTDSTAKDLQNRLIQTTGLLLSGDAKSASKALTTQYLRPVLLGPLKFFLFFLLFPLISAGIQVIIKGLMRLRQGETGRWFDQMAGAGIGCCEAVLFLWLMLKLTQWLVSAGGEDAAFFNSDTIEKTMLFRWIYDSFSS